MSRGITNQTWISNAIKNKIGKTENILKTETPRNKILSVKINPKDLAKITEQVEILKEHTGSYSKTKWLIEAICDQLEEEQNKIAAFPKIATTPPKRKLRGIIPLKVTDHSPTEKI